MRKSTSVLVSVLAASVCLVALVACGAGEQTTETTVYREPADLKTLNPPGTLPVVRVADTLRVFVSRDSGVASYAYGDNSFTTWLRDRTGVDVEVILPAGDPIADLRLRLASDGDAGDLILVSMPRTQLALYGSSGRVEPLNGLIDRYGFHFKDMLATFPDTLPAITAPDGNLYGFPQGNLTGLNPAAFSMRLWIQKEFLARYGGQMPETTSEMLDFLRWTRDSDANGNGDNSDEIGWTGAELHSTPYARPTGFFMNAFVLQDANGYYVKEDRIHCALVEPEYREGLRYLRQLMQEGLLDENYVSNDYNAIKALVDGGNGTTVATISSAGMHLAAQDPAIWEKYQIVPPLTGPGGFVNAQYDHYAAGMSVGKAFIPANSARKELATAWLDACCDQEVAMRSSLGEEEIDWTLPTDGAVAADGGRALYRKTGHVPTEDTTSSGWGMDTPALWDRYGVYARALPQDGAYNLAEELYMATRTYEPYVTPCTVPPFYFDEDTVEATHEWETMIDITTSNRIAEFIFGIRDVDSDAVWAEYVTDVREAGLDSYLQVLQDEYDRAWKGTLPSTCPVRPDRVS